MDQPNSWQHVPITLAVRDYNTYYYQHPPRLGQAALFSHPLPVRNVVAAFIELGKPVRGLSLAASSILFRCKGRVRKSFAPPPGRLHPLLVCSYSFTWTDYAARLHMGPDTDTWQSGLSPNTLGCLCICTTAAVIQGHARVWSGVPPTWIRYTALSMQFRGG